MSDGQKVLQAVQEALDQGSAFGDLLSAEERDFVLDQGIVRRAAPGESLCRQNQRDQRAFIIVYGEVSVVESVEGETVPLARLGRGELCGEIGALFGGLRHSTVSATRPSVLLELPGPALAELVRRNAGLRDAVIARYRRRLTDTAVRSVPLLRYLPEGTRQELMDRAAVVCFGKGAEIVREGERGDALYIVVYGTARVSHRIGGRALNLAILGPGDYFGEWALLTGAPRAATVNAATEVEALRIDCQPFLEFIQDHPEVRDRIDQVAHNRHEELRHAGALTESIEQLESLLSAMEDIMQEPEAGKPE